MADIEIIASAVGFDKVNRALEETNQHLEDTADEARHAGDSLNNNLRPGAAQATNALTNLGRVVSDAPYGFIGIANNIDPLLQSFQRLKDETGSVGGAVKALGGSLMGGGGLAFAVSAITSLMVVFSKELFSSSESMDHMSASTEIFTNTINNAKVNLDAMIMSIETAQKIKSIDFKIANPDKFAQGLFDASNNVETLDKKLVSLGDYLKDHTKQIIKVENEYDRLRQSFPDIPFTIDDAATSTEKLNKDVSATVDLWKTLKSEYKKAEADLAKLPDLIKLAKKEQQLATVETDRSRKAEKNKLQTREQYLAAFRESLKDEINIGIAELDPRFKERLKLIQTTIEGVISKFNQDPKSKLVVGLQSELARLEIEKFAVEAPSLVNQKIAKAKPIDMTKLLKVDVNDFVKKIPPLKLDNWITRTRDDFNKAFADFKSTAMEEAIISFADSIGQIIMGEMTFKDAFKAVFASLGDNIKQLGQQLIKIAILTKIAEKTLFTNPTAALAAGVGLVILGSALKAMMSKKAFATGTSFAPGGMALVGERGPELVNLPRGSQVIPAAQTASIIGGRNSIEVYGVLKGQDIYFSNKKYSQTYNRQS